MSDIVIPTPPPMDEMKPFWAGLNEHRFLLFRCKLCGAWYWPFAACRTCTNEPFFANIQLEEASGRGQVFSFTLPKWTFHPAFPAPFVYALVELEEGPVMPTNIIGCAPEEVTIGMPVEVEFVDLTKSVTLPKFRPQR